MASDYPRDSLDAILDALFAKNKGNVSHSKHEKLQKPKKSKYSKTKSEVSAELAEMFSRIRLSAIVGMLPIPVIHVAGTKGKGSTCVFTESILRAAGLKTGLFTSPHLLKITERVRINGENCPDELFLECFWRYWDRMHETAPSGSRMPSFFRSLMMVACDIFVRAQVDIVILEVGIGGRLDDTTAAISAGTALREDGSKQQLFECIACGVTLLDFDHTEILGDTLSAIGREKAGIFRPGVPAFTIKQRQEGNAALQEVAFKEATKLQFVPPLPVVGPDAWELGIGSDCQPSNAALALRLAEQVLVRHSGPVRLRKRLTAFRALGDAQKKAIYAKALKRVRFLGRSTCMQMPRASRAPVAVFMDGAHTPLSAECCFRWFQKQLPASTRDAALIFNCGHVRDPIPILWCVQQASLYRGLVNNAIAGMKHDKKINPFRTVIFCPAQAFHPTRARQKSTKELLVEAHAYLRSRLPRSSVPAHGEGEKTSTRKSRSQLLTAFWSQMEKVMPTKGHLIAPTRAFEVVNASKDDELPGHVDSFWSEMDKVMPTTGHLTTSAGLAGPADASTDDKVSKPVAGLGDQMDKVNTAGHLPTAKVQLLPGAKSLLSSAKTNGKSPLSWQQSLAMLWLQISDAKYRRLAPPLLPTATTPKDPSIVAVASNMTEAMEFVRDKTQCAHMLVTGSFFLVADALNFLNASK